jgi:hypothetical protein
LLDPIFTCVDEGVKRMSLVTAIRRKAIATHAMSLQIFARPAHSGLPEEDLIERPQAVPVSAAAGAGDNPPSLAFGLPHHTCAQGDVWDVQVKHDRSRPDARYDGDRRHPEKTARG